MYFFLFFTLMFPRNRLFFGLNFFLALLQVISTELVRNLSIAFAVIAAVSLLLITDLRVAIFVFLCVALTLLGKQSFSLKIILDIFIVK